MEKILRSDRAQGHIEMILSFVIFIGFVLVILFFINPVSDQKITYAAVDVAENSILSNLSFDYSYVGLILSRPYSGTAPCFAVSNIPMQTGVSVVKDSQGYLEQSVNDFFSNKIYIQKTNGERFYRIYFSNQFNKNSIPNFPTLCPDLDPSTYTFGPLYLDKAVLMENLPGLTNSYIQDYATLKKNLNVAENFEYVVYDLNRTVLFDTSSVHKLKTSIILARDLPLRALNRDANATDIVINVRVW